MIMSLPKKIKLILIIFIRFIKEILDVARHLVLYQQFKPPSHYIPLGQKLGRPRIFYGPSEDRRDHKSHLPDHSKLVSVFGRSVRAFSVSGRAHPPGLQLNTIFVNNLIDIVLFIFLTIALKILSMYVTI